ncbi:Antitoxin VapB [Pseudomonas sp. IT-194MI4]
MKRTVKKPRYTLNELIARCDPNAAAPAELADWDTMPLVGRELETWGLEGEPHVDPSRTRKNPR